MKTLNRIQKGCGLLLLGCAIAWYLTGNVAAGVACQIGGTALLYAD